MSGPFGSTPHNLFNTTSSDFYNGIINQSLRFDNDSSSSLKRTPGSAGNRRTFTFSAWVKRSNITSDQMLFGAGANAQNRFQIYFLSNDKLGVYGNTSNSDKIYAYTNAVFRDVSSWYNVVVAVDSTDGTAGNRLKMYVNGVEQSYTYATTPSQNEDFAANNTVAQSIGCTAYETSNLFDGYMAEVNLIDGTALTPSNFGQTKNGIWIPIEYSGSHGTNGFRLPFSQNASGFSALFNTRNTSKIVHSDSSSYDIGGSDDFTIEFFFNTADVGANYGNFMGEYATSGPHHLISYDFRSSTRYLYWYTGNGASFQWDVSGDVTLVASKWHHVVFQRDGTTLRAYIDGTRLTTVTDAAGNTGFTLSDGKSTNFNKSYNLSKITTGDPHGQGFVGYLSNVRYVIGATVYADDDNDITVPTATLTAVTGTKLLTCVNGTVGDDISSENNDGTVTSTTASTVNPFGTFNFFSDVSGNANDFGPDNINDIDVMLDSPESNFPVMNSICDAGSAQSIFAFTEGNLKVRNTASNYSQAITTQSVRTGKWYYECYINEAGYPSWQIGWMVGRQNGLGENEFPTFAGAANDEQKSFTGLGYFTSSDVYISDWGSGTIGTQQIAYSGLHSAGDAPTTGDIIGVAADFDNRRFWWHINGEYIDVGSGTGNPSTGANVSSTYTASEAPDDAEKYPWLTAYGTASFVFNFGQDGTFAGNKIAQGNADENGVGNFFYAVPSGFLAFTSKSFSDTELSPNSTEQATDHFNTLLWTGDGNTSRAITGVGFTPDWLWLKCRSNGEDHCVEDTVRGAGNKIEPNNNGNTDTTATAVLSSHDADGFTGPSSSPGNLNVTDRTYVGWFWKAGGTPTATNSAGAGNVPTTGSVMIDGVASTSSLAGTLPANKISANTKAGFSIVQFTGNNSNSTIAHGLTSAPDVCVVKKTSGTGNWFVYTRAENDQASDEAHVGYFNISTAAFAASATIFNDTPPTDTVFSVGTGNSNNNSATYIAYLFHEVEGFSKFGYFAGNSSADGTFVYCGFKPARIWLRQDATGIDWTSYDLLREGFNVENDSLRFATSATEQADDDLDILSNGFKMRRNMANNQGDVMFFAWADSPVKYSNSR